MRELKLHSLGKNNHLKSLKEKYNLLRNKIIRNDRLTENEKNNELNPNYALENLLRTEITAKYTVSLCF